MEGIKTISQRQFNCISIDLGLRGAKGNSFSAP